MGKTAEVWSRRGRVSVCRDKSGRLLTWAPVDRAYSRWLYHLDAALALKIIRGDEWRAMVVEEG